MSCTQDWPVTLKVTTNIIGYHPFNPIKVQFLPPIRCDRCWERCLSILSRFNFYKYGDKVVSLKITLSILSRFNFYYIAFITSRRNTISFNPIKVQFLHRYDLWMWEKMDNFQSYQGSIFTVVFISPLYLVPLFQSYQGSIFT